MTGLCLKAGMSSLQGCGERNEDHAAISASVWAYAIADGIGGAQDGDYISRIGCGAGIAEYERSRNLVQSFSYANRAAVQVSEWLNTPASGATLLLADFDGTNLSFAGAGDTAAFRLRGGRIERLTPLGRHRSTGRLDNAIGYSKTCEPYQASCSVEPGDRYILCTDGVWDVFAGGRGGLLAEELNVDQESSAIAANIVKKARQLGSSDDATAIVLLAV